MERGIDKPESISDHMHRMSLMAMLIDDPALDRAKCVKIAVVHVCWAGLLGAFESTCFSVAFCSQFPTPLLSFTLFKDLAECIVGDLTPHCGISKEEKHKLEMEAMQSLVNTLGGTPVALEIQALWLEYETAATNEARFVKDLDKFEMIVQAFEYEKGFFFFPSFLPASFLVFLDWRLS